MPFSIDSLILADADGIGFIIFFLVAFFSWLFNFLKSAAKDGAAKQARPQPKAGETDAMEALRKVFSPQASGPQDAVRPVSNRRPPPVSEFTDESIVVVRPGANPRGQFADRRPDSSMPAYEAMQRRDQEKSIEVAKQQRREEKESRQQAARVKKQASEVERRAVAAAAVAAQQSVTPKTNSASKSDIYRPSEASFLQNLSGQPAGGNVVGRTSHVYADLLKGQVRNMTDIRHAVVLNELLGPPVSQRERRRRG